MVLPCRPGQRFTHGVEINVSYDLTVYCPGSPALDQVLLLVGNTRGIQADPAAPSTGDGPGLVQVLRGGYSFTVDGPFALRPEDVPEEVSEILPNAETMCQVLVEGTVESEIPHGTRFARKLAKACHGVVLDEQTSEVWPQPRSNAPSAPKVYPRADAAEFTWYSLADEMPSDLPQRYLRLAEEHLPQALPTRFGTYDPPQGDFERDGKEGFVRAWEELIGKCLNLETTYPVTWAYLRAAREQLEGDVREIRMTVAHETLEDNAFRARAHLFFISVAIESRAFHATAEVVRNYALVGKELRSDSAAEMYRLSALRRKWVGLKPHAQWWTWFGPLYADAVRPYLTGHREEHAEGIFHSWTDEPKDRDALVSFLPSQGTPWIPAEYSPDYEEGVVQPLSIAETIPERLREVRVEPHAWTEA